MVYKTTDTTSFNLDLNNLVEEAFERCGAELRSGYDLRTARRSLNLLTIEWANRGINMWTIEQGSITLVPGQITYNLPVDTIDLLDHVIRTGTGTNQIDINISRISVSTYSQIPNKNATGRPIQVWIDRKSGATGQAQPTSVTPASLNIYPDSPGYSTYLYTMYNPVTTFIPGYYILGDYIQPGTRIVRSEYDPIGEPPYLGFVELSLPTTNYNTIETENVSLYATNPTNNPTINVWPAPDNSTTYTFYYWRLRRMQDAGDGINGQDIPFRFLPCLVAGLAYYLSLKIPGAMERSANLKQMYDEQFQLASEEDREKAPVRFVPRDTFIR